MPERTHIPDHCLNKNPRPQTKTRLPPFLSESPRLCLDLHSLHTCTPSINSAFTSCWLEFNFYPVHSQGHSWLVLQDALRILGPDLPASASRCRSSRTCHFVVWLLSWLANKSLHVG